MDNSEIIGGRLGTFSDTVQLIVKTILFWILVEPYGHSLGNFWS